MTKGWKLESARHSLARRRIKTGKKIGIKKRIKSNLYVLFPTKIQKTIEDVISSQKAKKEDEEELLIEKKGLNRPQIIKELKDDIEECDEYIEEGKLRLKYFAKKQNLDYNTLMTWVKSE